MSRALAYESAPPAAPVDISRYRTRLRFFVNGKEYTVSDSTPGVTLLEWLRSIGLSGTKLGCGEGGCGACTVMVSSYDVRRSAVQHASVNACLMPLCAADQCAITTVEGIGSVKAGLHPVQQRMWRMHGSQCGFCTPGIIMALYTLFRNDPEATVSHLEEHMDGNLCRCTGYRPILDAARSLCVDVERCAENGCAGSCAAGCANGCSNGPGCGNGVGTGCGNGGVNGCVNGCGGGGDVSGASCGSSGYGGCGSGDDEVVSTGADKAAEAESSTPYAGSAAAAAEPAFPEELKAALEPLAVTSGDTQWWRPDSLAELLALKAAYPSSRLVVGNTEVGIEARFKGVKCPVLLSTAGVKELRECATSADGLSLGACAPLSDISALCETIVNKGGAVDKPGASGAAGAIRDMLRWFASTQIRNVACLGGNLATASPISDMNPLLAAVGSELVIGSAARGERRVLVRDFFKGYRRVDLQPDELILRIVVPPTRQYEFVLPIKQARRREDDISIVTATLRVLLRPEAGAWIVSEAALAFGGMAATTVLADATAAALVGQPWTNQTFDVACAALRDELRVPAGAPGGQSEYRTALAVSFLFKLYVTVALRLEELPAGGLPTSPTISAEERSATRSFVHEPKPAAVGTQRYPLKHDAVGLEVAPASKSLEIAPAVPGAAPSESQAAAAAAAIKASKASAGNTDAAEVVVGANLPHAAGAMHTTGEAIYVDDFPNPPGALHSCLVRAKQAPARILSVDSSSALAAPGVKAVFFATDLDGENDLGPIVHDEECFAAEKTSHVGQVIGIAVAETAEQARVAAELVKVEYESLGRALVNIEAAIEAGSFYPFSEHVVESGPPVDTALAQDGLVVVEGTFKMGGQEHFYLECNTTLAVPSEGCMEVLSSTQAVTKTQNCVAHVCGIPANKVVAKVKRMGGGFGGKETRSVFASCAAAVAAHKLGVPVRLSLTRDVDMSSTGGRHAFLVKYRAAAWPPAEGGAPKLAALDVKFYSNGGACFDLSGPVLDRAILHVDNCYKWPSVRSWGVVCRTAQPPHTAFRGFGGPQGMIATEAIVDHLASALRLPSHELRAANLYSPEDSTHFGQPLEGPGWRVPRAFAELQASVKLGDARAAANAFNATNKWRKRGIALVPTKYGINYTAKFMNQGGALVHLYTDGTVLISHGGTEMGQGLHTKVSQVAAKAFGLPLSKVHIAETATDKVANSQPTAASMSTDLYGMATLDACRQILARLVPLRKRMPDAPLAKLAQVAFYERIDLSAHGFYVVDDSRCGYDFNASPPPLPDGTPDNAARGHPFNYFTQGVGFAEVEVDVLTGDHEVQRAELLVDVGSAINPALDIGQIEGAFTQGMGWCTIEELIWGDDDHEWVRPPGRLFTQGPGAYKIPSFNDTPRSFNVTLMSGVDNKYAIHSSKAIGEPPFFLGCSVFFAIKDAIQAARAEHIPDAADAFYPLFSPATSERIRMACADRFAVSTMDSAAGEAIALAAKYQPKCSC